MELSYLTFVPLPVDSCTVTPLISSDISFFLEAVIIHVEIFLENDVILLMPELQMLVDDITCYF